MFCKKCGKMMTDDSQFCAYCGTSMDVPKQLADSESAGYMFERKDEKSDVQNHENASKSHTSKRELFIKNIDILVLLIIISVLVVTLIIKRSAGTEKKYGESETDRSEYQISTDLSDDLTNEPEDGYIPYIDVDDIGFAGANLQIDDLKEMGFEDFDEYKALMDYGLIKLSNDQHVWFTNVSGVQMMAFYDDSAKRVVGDQWFFQEEQMTSIKQGWKSINANVDPRIIRIDEEDSSSQPKTYLIWKYNGGYVVFNVREDGTDNWLNWNVKSRNTIEDVSQIEHYSESERLHVESNQNQDMPVIKVKESKKDEPVSENNSNIPKMKEGSLPDGILEEIGGHYEDSYGDTVDLQTTLTILRFIKGGNQSHTYNEKICGYSALDDGYLLYVDGDGDKYTYLYKNESGIEYLYINAVEGWEPALNPYNYNSATVFIKKEQDNKQPADPDVAGDYLVGTMCSIVKQDDYYILYLNSDNAFITAMYDWGKTVSCRNGIKIAPNAKVGVAVKMDYIPSEYGPEGFYSYEYYDFYKVVDDLFANGHWQKTDNVLYFVVDDMQLLFCPIITLNEYGEIVKILDYYED